MSEPFERLRLAREAAGFESASDAANAMGAKVPTYIHHENGTSGLSRAGARYARFFGVSYEWLMQGRGDMKAPASANVARLPIEGVVGAGARVEMFPDPAGDQEFGTVDLPLDGTLGVLVVRGDSQWPRFLDGERVIFDKRPVLPPSLIGRYAIVQTLDGDRMIKILRRGTRENLWKLESHNAPPIEDVRLLGVWRYVGVLEAR